MARDPDKQVMEKAYARWAPVYDVLCGPVFVNGRREGESRNDRQSYVRDSCVHKVALRAGDNTIEIKFDSAIEPREAASRRDFTVNALMFDPLTAATAGRDRSRPLLAPQAESLPAGHSQP